MAASAWRREGWEAFPAYSHKIGIFENLSLLGYDDGKQKFNLRHSPHCGEMGAKHSPRSTRKHKNPENSRNYYLKIPKQNSNEAANMNRIIITLQSVALIRKLNNFPKIRPSGPNVPSGAGISGTQREITLL